MIQRIQSLYLFASLVLTILCMSLSIGRLTTGGLPLATISNLSVTTTEGLSTHEPWALMAILALTVLSTLLCILLYRKRMRQVRLCILNGLLYLGYIACYTLFMWVISQRYEADFTPSVAAALPILCLILNYLAWRGIMKDELLVRSLDRLR